MQTLAGRGLVVFLLTFVLVGSAVTQTAPNSDPVYLQLRKLGLGTEAISVNNVILKRDAGTFTFASGSICFATPVQGKVTGAVFVGNGSFTLTPPLDIEKHHLKLLTGDQPMSEDFNELVLRFTDDTYDVLKKATGAAAGGSCPSGIVADNSNMLQHNLHYNVSGRVLQDLLGEGPGGLFMAFIKGKKFSGKMVYAMDVHGAPILPGQVWNPGVGTMPAAFDVSPEEVELLTWDPNKFGVWAAFHYASEYAAGKANGGQENGWIDIEKQDIDAAFDRSGRMDAKTTTTFLSRVQGLRVVPFDLFPTLRVQSVTDAEGKQLPFIQEDKDLDPQFFVILPKGLAAGEKFALTTTYSGKDAMRAEGVGNFYPIARENWYPNTRINDYATYEMRFTTAKGMTMVATGKPVSEEAQGDAVVTRWTSEQPQTVAGFQFGKFKKATAKLARPQYAIESYANTDPPDYIRDYQAKINMARQGNQGTRQALANETPQGIDVMNTTMQIQNAIADAQMSLPLYTEYFGPAPFSRLTLTQQTADNYGQSWPGLVWLPISYFWDPAIRHELGMDDPKGYFTVVGPHEIAHQWFIHTITRASYRDVWMEEGFAEFAASLFLQRYSKEPTAFTKFWNDELELMQIKNPEGYRATEVGPVTLGIRTVTTKAGEDIYRRLIYTKGAYILHMIRMMMYDPKFGGDDRFKAMMHEFVKTFAGRRVTTEDFKAVVEKHMIPAMDLAGDHTMDWFFNEYVYGTAMPHYKFTYSVGKGADGSPVLSFKLTQSNVDDNFGMIVPIYIEMGKNNFVRLGAANMIGNKTIEQQVPLAGLKEPPKRLAISYYNDVLGIIDK